MGCGQACGDKRRGNNGISLIFQEMFLLMKNIAGWLWLCRRGTCGIKSYRRKKARDLTVSG
jgi:hypothetical protein